MGRRLAFAAMLMLGFGCVLCAGPIQTCVAADRSADRLLSATNGEYGIDYSSDVSSDGNTVAWSYEDDTLGWRVMVHDLDSNETTVVATTGSVPYNVKIAGEWVAWEEQSSGVWYCHAKSYVDEASCTVVSTNYAFEFALGAGWLIYQTNGSSPNSYEKLNLDYGLILPFSDYTAGLDFYFKGTDGTADYLAFWAKEYDPSTGTGSYEPVLMDTTGASTSLSAATAGVFWGGPMEIGADGVVSWGDDGGRYTRDLAGGSVTTLTSDYDHVNSGMATLGRTLWSLTSGRSGAVLPDDTATCQNSIVGLTTNWTIWLQDLTDLAGGHRKLWATPQDKMPPQTTATLSDTDWTSASKVWLTLSATDASGVDSTDWALGDDAFTPYASTVAISDEGLSTVKYRSTDVWGNVEDTRTAEVRIDRTAPTTSAAQTTTGSFSLVATDELSGVATTRWRFGRSGVWQTGSVATTSATPPCLQYYSVDAAGNAEYMNELAIEYPPAATTLGLACSQEQPAYGKAITLSADLLGDGAAVAGQEIVFERQAGTQWVSVGDADTDSQGQASVSVKPYASSTTTYRASFAGTTSYATVTSSSVVVTPKVSLTKGNAPKTMYAGKARTVAGKLKPRHPAGSRAVRIYCSKKIGGKWVSRGRVRARLANRKGYSQYSASLKFASKGKWRIRAFMPADAKHAATYSNWDYVTVR